MPRSEFLEWRDFVHVENELNEQQRRRAARKKPSA